MPIFYSEPKNTNTDNTLTNNAISLGSPTDVDAFYVVGTGIATITWTGFADPANTPNNNLGNINTAALTTGEDGKRYALYTFKSKTSGAKTLTFTALSGQTLAIDELYLMESLFDFDDDDTFTQITMNSVERNAILMNDLYGNTTKVKGYTKRKTSYTAERQTIQKLWQFEVFREDNPNFYFLEDFEQVAKLPNRLYPAIMGAELNTRYSTLDKTEGINIDFEIIQR